MKHSEALLEVYDPKTLTEWVMAKHYKLWNSRSERFHEIKDKRVIRNSSPSWTACEKDSEIGKPKISLLLLIECRTMYAFFRTCFAMFERSEVDDVLMYMRDMGNNDESNPK